MSAALSTGLAVPVGRNEARESAERELSKRIYHADDPSPFERILDSVARWIDEHLGAAANASPGGPVGLLVLVLLAAGLIALILWRTGPLRRSGAVDGAPIELSGPLDADEHRRRADRFAAQRHYAEAIRERMRAIVRELETRGVLEPRPGRTADEVANEAGLLVPGILGDLQTAARIFDEVWYGGRVANVLADAAIREADHRVRSAQLTFTGTATGGTGSLRYQVPR